VVPTAGPLTRPGVREAPGFSQLLRTYKNKETEMMYTVPRMKRLPQLIACALGAAAFGQGAWAQDGAASDAQSAAPAATA